MRILFQDSESGIYYPQRILYHIGRGEVVERSITAEAVILRTKRCGETARRITLLTRELGTIDALAYGARRGKGVSGITQFSTCTFYLYYNPVKRLYFIKDVDVLEDGSGIMLDLDKVLAASFLSELAIRSAGSENKEFFEIFKSAFKALSGQLITDRILIKAVWDYMAVIGMASDLETCPSCERRYGEEEVLGFSSALSAPVCSSCATPEETLLLPPGARRYLKLIADLPFAEAVLVPLSETAQRRIRGYVLSVAEHVTGMRFKSLTSMA